MRDRPCGGSTSQPVSQPASDPTRKNAHACHGELAGGAQCVTHSGMQQAQTVPHSAWKLDLPGRKLAVQAVLAPTCGFSTKRSILWWSSITTTPYLEGSDTCSRVCMCVQGAGQEGCAVRCSFPPPPPPRGAAAPQCCKRRAGSCGREGAASPQEYRSGAAPASTSRGCAPQAPTLVTRMVPSAPVRKCCSSSCFIGYSHTTSLHGGGGGGGGGVTSTLRLAVTGVPAGKVAACAGQAVPEEVPPAWRPAGSAHHSPQPATRPAWQAGGGRAVQSDPASPSARASPAPPVEHKEGGVGLVVQDVAGQRQRPCRSHRLGLLLGGQRREGAKGSGEGWEGRVRRKGGKAEGAAGWQGRARHGWEHRAADACTTAPAARQKHGWQAAWSVARMAIATACGAGRPRRHRLSRKPLCSMPAGFRQH